MLRLIINNKHSNKASFLRILHLDVLDNCSYLIDCVNVAKAKYIEIGEE